MPYPVPVTFLGFYSAKDMIAALRHRRPASCIPPKTQYSILHSRCMSCTAVPRGARPWAPTAKDTIAALRHRRELHVGYDA